MENEALSNCHEEMKTSSKEESELILDEGEADKGSDVKYVPSLPDSPTTSDQEDGTIRKDSSNENDTKEEHSSQI